MPGPEWLTARPIAHRGLHDATCGVIENTPSAVAAAVAAGYGIEVDLQIAADGEAMVHHDAVLGRLTEGSGRLDAMTAADLKRVPFKATADRMLALGDLLDLIGGRVPLVLELKSRFDRDLRLCRRAAQTLKPYPGPVAAMSFDPYQMEAMRDFSPGLPRGVVAQRYHSHPGEPAHQRDRLATLLRGVRSWPRFMAYNVNDLPATMPLLARNVFGMPLLAWTVRTQADWHRAERWADQLIFEGIRP
jgi:glycerophosphoryl diester phosphodiesterase